VKIVDFKLSGGGVANSVDVTTGYLELSLASSTLSSIVGGQTVRDLPLNGRDWTLLAALEPGVHAIEAQTEIAAGSNSREDRGSGAEMTVDGGRPQQNNYRLDAVAPAVSLQNILRVDREAVKLLGLIEAKEVS
jgi:hypothetical protein